MSRNPRRKSLLRMLLVAFARVTERPDGITREEWVQVKNARRTNAKARKARRQRIRTDRRKAA